ncbi:hypothetical protein M8C21_015989 [Ambrosia artemisiifolia]|uniref:C3H1-type domain-containing protein n=1 Tax=Ambrosia artemisiifolia TaxID=4212 RepID=A0AAD5CQC0_AMBAR|nr:hypothetical protein M8C21_015989 [Ambrosia artemisiifolia]
MPPRKEPCRNFQRGFCQYGERCKFLHVNQQQTKPNPFGFGAQNTSQSQKPNPFGFGSQNAAQPQKPNPFGFGVQNNSKANQFKPGENKWSRFSPSSGNPTAAQKQDGQSSAANHVCTDSEACKHQISEDFQQEKPLWKLTCYGHSKYGPCDIIGDVSYEELRASAYDDAKRGTNVQSIVEKERSLLNSKLIEFENLLRNPYTPPSNSNLNTQNTLPGPSTNIFPQTAQTNGPSSFNQNTLPGTTTNIFPQTVQNNGPPTVSSFNQAPAQNNAFSQVNQFQAPTQISNAPQKNNFAFGNTGQLGNQPSTQPFVSSTFANAFSTAPSPNFNSPTQQPSMPVDGQNPSAIPGVKNTSQNVPHSTSSEHDSIWFKDEWRAGEIPEEAPPAGVIF